MRWYYPKHGDIRRKRKFLLWPRYYGGIAYWLEWVIVEVRYYNYPGDHFWAVEKIRGLAKK